MQKMKKCSSSKHVPVEIVTQIVKKVVDLKTLCVCKRVSKRFNKIVREADTIVYTCESDNFELAMESLMKFTLLRSVRIVVPSEGESADDPTLYNWKITFGSRIDSFVFLSLNSIEEKNEIDSQENDEEEEEEEDDDCLSSSQKCQLAMDCLEQAVDRFKMLLRCIHEELPLLQMVSITDSDNRGKITAGQEKISQLRKLKGKAGRIRQVPGQYCYVSSLKLPVSGYVMKGVTIILKGVDGFMERDDDDGNVEEIIYNEAIREMLQRDDFTEIPDEGI